MPALALTDSNNLFGALEFSEAAAEAGVQPIIGLALNVKGEGGLEGVLALLAQNSAGYSNLMRLSSSAYLDVAAHDEPHVSIARLFDHSEGLIALTGGAMARWRTWWSRTSMSAHKPSWASLQRSFPTGSTSNCSATASASKRKPKAHLVELRLQARPAAGRHQRHLLQNPQRSWGPRRAAVHRGGLLPRPGRASAGHRGALVQERRRRCARSSPTCRKPATTPSTSPAAAPSGRKARSDPAGVRHRARPLTKPTNWRARREGPEGAPEGAGRSPGSARGGLRDSASSTSSTSSSRWASRATS